MSNPHRTTLPRHSPKAYYGGWSRALKAAGATHVGTHCIRHRSTTDIANSGIPVRVAMELTAHRTVAMFMRYVHTEDDPCARLRNWSRSDAKR
ncbi:tyrosine-type recombinase/integrase [Aeromonas caviae]|uniref:tyrosine-type recombinase/integrase n=1 Tax=Aeromonas caviae TaxID=648 RepID=UPI003F743E2C